MGNLIIQDVYTPVPASPDTAAAYFIVLNTGDMDDALLSAASDMAADVQLHEVVMQGGAMKMQQVPRIPVPAHGQARLRPGGLHVMLLGLRRPLREGDRYDLRLTFERAGTITVSVPVRAATAAQGAATAPPTPAMGH